MQTCLTSWKFAALQASVLKHSKPTAETKTKHHLCACTMHSLASAVLCQPAGSSACMVKAGGPQGKAQEVYDCQFCRRCKTAIFDRSKVSASCLSRALPRELSRFYSYACHSCTGGLNLHSDQDNLDACVCALLQSAARSLRTRNKHAPSQRRAAVTRLQAALTRDLFKL